MEKFLTKNFKETQKLGEDFAHYLSSPRKRGSRAGTQILDSHLHGNDKQNEAIIVCLQGDLGGGKTTFLQGFAKGLGIKEKILSPTFVIMKKFKFSPRSVISRSVVKNVRTHKYYNDRYFYHFDCYRINKPEEILELGFKEIISNPGNIVAVEWPEKIKKVLPKSAIKIDFKFIDEQTRELTIKK